MNEFGGQSPYEQEGPAGRLESSLNFDRHVLVIGGAGYIGSLLVRKLLQQGYRVKVLDNLIYQNGTSIADLAECDEFSFVYGDFGNPATLIKALDDITDVVLLAALVGDPVCNKYPELARKINLEYPKKLLETLKGRDIRRFVFTSTCSNYGMPGDDTLADETSEFNPQSLYGEDKVAFEQHILGSLAAIDFCPVILRLSTAYGISNRMRFDLPISEFTRDLARGKDLLVYDENILNPYCHISDISNAIIGVLEARTQEVYGQVFNVGSDSGHYTKKMLAEIILKYIPDAVVKYGQSGLDPRNYLVSFEKIRAVLEFNTGYTAEDSVKVLIRALRTNLFPDTEERKNFYGNYVISG